VQAYEWPSAFGVEEADSMRASPSQDLLGERGQTRLTRDAPMIDSIKVVVHGKVRPRPLHYLPNSAGKSAAPPQHSREEDERRRGPSAVLSDTEDC